MTVDVAINGSDDSYDYNPAKSANNSWSLGLGPSTIVRKATRSFIPGSNDWMARKLVARSAEPPKPHQQVKA